MIARSTFRPAALVALALAAVAPACNKKKPEEETKKEEAKKDVDKTKQEIADVAAPENLAFEMTFKDPDGLAKKVVDAAGLSAQIGPDPYAKAMEEAKDADMQTALRAIDPHGAASLVVAAKLDTLLDAIAKKKGSPPSTEGDQIDWGFAVHLKDGDAVKLATDAITKKGKLKAQDAKSFKGTIYAEEGDKRFALGLVGDYAVMADGPDAVERIGAYTAQIARKAAKSSHDLSFHVPTDAMETKAKAAIQKAWDNAKTDPDAPPHLVAEVDKLLPTWLEALSDAGDLTATMDLDGDNLVAKETLPAKGSLSKYLAGYPVTDASSLLSLPKGEMAAVYRLGDGLGPLLDGALDDLGDSMKKKAAAGTPKPGEPDPDEVTKNLKALRASIGHEIAYSGRTSAFMASLGGPDETIGGLELFARVDLSDPKTAKSSLTYFRDLVEKMAKSDASAPAFTHAAYTKNGADGETITADEKKGAAPNSTFIWAMKDNSLYLDFCLRCAATMVDDALDPASKNTFASDENVKKKTDALKSKDLVSVSYGDSLGIWAGAMMFMVRAGPGVKAPSLPTLPPTFSYVRATGDGLEMDGEVPVAMFGMLAKYLTMSKTVSSSPAMTPPVAMSASAMAVPTMMTPPPPKPIK